MGIMDLLPYRSIDDDDYDNSRYLPRQDKIAKLIKKRREVRERKKESSASAER